MQDRTMHDRTLEDTTRPPDTLSSAPLKVAPAGGPRKTQRGAFPFVIAQLGQSLDGRIATPSGESKYINGPHALDHLHALRASVDAVLVGVGTVVADDPLLTVRRCAGRNPARVVIDPQGRANPAARCFNGDGTRRLVVRRRGILPPPAAGVEVVEADGAEAFEPGAILAALAAAGLHRILVEGGPSTLARFLAAGAVDVLHVFVSPVILGAGPVGIARPDCPTLAHALRPAARVSVLPDGDVLFSCDLSGRGMAPADGTEARLQAIR